MECKFSNRKALLALAKNYDKTLPGLKTHSCLVFPPNVPSHPLLLSWKPFLQHIPVSPHHEHFPCLLLQFIQQSLPAFLRLRAVTHCKNSSLYIHLLNDFISFIQNEKVGFQVNLTILFICFANQLCL